MVCKTRLEERQAAMRQRQVAPVAQIPDEEIRHAIGVFLSALSQPPVRAEEVTAQLVSAGVKFSAAELARKQLGIVERNCRGEVWLLLPARKLNRSETA
jgi:hypothetical protein